MKKTLTLGIALSIFLVVFSTDSLGSWTLPGFPTTQELDSDPEIDDATIAKWIQQLGSPRYVERESAAERLSQLGKRGKTALEQARQSTDPGIATRAQQLLNKMVTTSKPDLTPDQQRIYQMLKSMSNQPNVARMSSMLTSQKLKFSLRLLNEFPKLKKSFFAGDASQLNTMLVQAIIRNEWKEVEAIVNDPLIIRESPATCYYYHHAQGTVDSWIKSQLDELRQSREVENAEPIFSDRQLKSLISILRIQRRFEEALEVTQWLPDNLHDEWHQQILLESGDWKKVLPHLIDPADKKPNDLKIPANQAQRALIQNLAGDETGYQDTVAKLQQELKDASKTENEIGVEMARSQLLMIGLTNLDWPLVKNTLPADKVEANYTLLADLLRYQDCFESIKLGDSFESRNAWIENKIEELEEVKRKLSKADRKQKGYRELQARRTSLTNLILQVIDQLGMLGFDQELDIYLQLLFKSQHEDHTLRNRILVYLTAHERYETCWSLVENGLPQTSASNIASQIFLDRSTSTQSFFNGVKSRYEDPLDQLKAIAVLLNSPMALERQRFSFDKELAAYRSSLLFANSGAMDQVTANLLELNGRFAERDDHLARAAKLGYTLASTRELENKLANQDYTTAAKILRDTWKLYRNAAEPLLESMCLRNLAAQETDLEKRNSLLREAAKMQFAGTASWQSRSYAAASAIVSLTKYEHPELAKFILQGQVYGLNGVLVNNPRYHPQLIEVLNHEGDPDFQQAGVELAIGIFRNMSVNDVASKTNSYWAESALQMHMALARGEITAGKPQPAIARLKRCADFKLYDTSLGEKTLPQLDAMGAVAEADELFAQLTRRYVDLFVRYPQSPLHRNNYAWICACAQRRTESIQRHIDIARRMRPNNSSYLDTLAEIHYRNGEFEKALELNKRCIMLNNRKPFYRQQRRKFLTAAQQQADTERTPPAG